MGLRLSPHQLQGFCAICAEDASANNHCAWCGRTYASEEELLNHLDGQCGTEIQKAYAEYMGGVDE